MRVFSFCLTNCRKLEKPSTSEKEVVNNQSEVFFNVSLDFKPLPVAFSV